MAIIKNSKNTVKAQAETVLNGEKNVIITVSPEKDNRPKFGIISFKNFNRAIFRSVFKNANNQSSAVQNIHAEVGNNNAVLFLNDIQKLNPRLSTESPAVINVVGSYGVPDAIDPIAYHVLQQ